MESVLTREGSHWQSESAMAYQEMLQHPENGQVAFDRIFDLNFPKAYSLAYSVLDNKQDAEEVAQDVMVRVWKRSSIFRGESKFSTWIYRITMNLAKNRYRWNKTRGSRQTVSLDEMAAREDGEWRTRDLGFCDTSLNPSEKMGLDELERDAIAGIDELPELYRQALFLRNVKELSYEGIADLLGIKMGTVKSRIARAKEGLRKKLGL